MINLFGRRFHYTKVWMVLEEELACHTYRHEWTYKIGSFFCNVFGKIETLRFNRYLSRKAKGK